MTILWSNELARTGGDSGGARQEGPSIGSCAPESSCGVRAEAGKAGLGEEESSAQSSRSESQQNCAGLGAEWGIPPAGNWDLLFSALIHQVDVIEAARREELEPYPPEEDQPTDAPAILERFRY